MPVTNRFWLPLERAYHRLSCRGMTGRGRGERCIIDGHAPSTKSLDLLQHHIMILGLHIIRVIQLLDICTWHRPYLGPILGRCSHISKAPLQLRFLQPGNAAVDAIGVSNLHAARGVDGRRWEVCDQVRLWPCLCPCLRGTDLTVSQIGVCDIQKAGECDGQPEQDHIGAVGAAVACE